MHPKRKQYKTVDAYIAAFPAEVRVRLEKMRQTIHKAVPTIEEGISYRIPVFKYNGKYLVYVAAYEHHIGFYPIPKGSKELEKLLSKYKAGTGTLRFPHDKPIPDTLVKKIVIARKKEHLLRWPHSEFPNTLSAPALRALANAKITTLSQLAKHTEAEILTHHGIGPSALPILRNALRAKGLSFTRPNSLKA